MRLVLDQGLPRDAAGRLRGLGYECVHVGEIGMWKAADEEILEFSRGKDAIVGTPDASSRPSVIRLRMQGLGAAEVVDLILRVLGGFESDLIRGSLVTVKARKTTCHRLPIGNSD
jgi:predicted nuclease of predicted toxin-antitoxin system